MRQIWPLTRGWGALVALAIGLCLSVPGQTDLYGDLSNDGVANAPDVVQLIDHFDPGKPSLPPQIQPFADADRNGTLNEDDLRWVIDAVLRRVGLFAVDPIVRFAEPSTTVTEANQDIALIVALRGYNDTPGASISYAVTGGTATEGVDFATMGTMAPIVIDRAVIPLSIFDDAEREGTEFIEITIGAVSGFPNELPSRHIVFIEDTERLWRGSLAAGTSTYTDVSSVDLIMIDNAGAVSGVLVGETTPSVPNGDWPAEVMLSPSAFSAIVGDLPVAVGNDFFGTSISRTLILGAVFPGVEDKVIRGLYVDEYTAPGAPHLDRRLEGTFDLYLVPDAPPDVDPEVQGP